MQAISFSACFVSPIPQLLFQKLYVTLHELLRPVHDIPIPDLRPVPVDELEEPSPALAHNASPHHLLGDKEPFQIHNDDGCRQDKQRFFNVAPVTWVGRNPHFVCCTHHVVYFDPKEFPNLPRWLEPSPMSFGGEDRRWIDNLYG